MRFETRNVSKRMLRRLGHPCRAPSSVVGRAEEVSLSSTPPPPPAGGVGSYNHHYNGEEDGVEASVVVCERLKPPRLCHTENQPEVRKTATPKTSTRCARGAMSGARGAFVSLSAHETVQVQSDPPTALLNPRWQFGGSWTVVGS